jgi:hypothetical protein
VAAPPRGAGLTARQRPRPSRTATLHALPAILDPNQDGFHDTNSPDDLGPLAQHPLSGSVA